MILKKVAGKLLEGGRKKSQKTGASSSAAKGKQPASATDPSPPNRAKHRERKTRLSKRTIHSTRFFNQATCDRTGIKEKVVMAGGKRPDARKKGKKHRHVPTYCTEDAQIGGTSDDDLFEDALDLGQASQVPSTQQHQIQQVHQPQPLIVQVPTQIQLTSNQQTTGFSPETAGRSEASGKLVLDPTTLWFEDEKVKKVISRSIQSYYRAPWRNYGQVDDATKTHWWDLFSQKFTWAPELDAQVRKSFHSRAGSRLRDMFYTVTHQMNGARPYWVSEDIHKQMLVVIAEDDVYKKRSAQNKKNRRGGSMENQIEATHFQGSISAIQHAKRMASENEGKLPSAPDLFLHTHFKDVKGKGKVPANSKAKQIADTYQKKVEEACSQGLQRTENEMYWEAVGGRTKKGHVKGLGRGAELYYGTTGQFGSSQQYTPSVVSQMQDRFEKQVETIRTEMWVEMEAEIEARVAAQVSAMERRNKEFMDKMLSRVPAFNTQHP